MGKGFTPLETIGKQDRAKVSLTGFTLVEIMIVVAIVMILATLAAPSILRSRIIAYEAATVANLKTLGNACQSYHIDQLKYPESLSELGQENPPYIDPVLASGNKQGYSFVYALRDSGFTINANPTGILRGRYFYTDETSIIRARTDGPAGPDDEIIR